MFPKLWTVVHHARTDGDENSHGIAREEFADPGEPIAVYGYAPPSPESEPFEGGRGALVRDLDVLGDAQLAAVTERDRVSIPDGHYAGTYDVVGGFESFDSGPFGFTPGGRISLKMVKEDER